MHDYIWTSQLVQYQQYKSLIEGYIIQQYIYYTAVYVWKSQSPWPTLRGALYDYYLDSTGGYWGIHSVLVNKGEKRHWPVIVMNIYTRYLVLVNRLFTPIYTPITALVECVDLSGAVIYTDRYTFPTPLPANGVLTSTYAVPNLTLTYDIQGYICFISLNTSSSSTSTDRSSIGMAGFHLPNMYWFSGNTTAYASKSSGGSGSGVYEQPDYSGFGHLRKMGLGEVSVTSIQPLTAIPTVRPSKGKDRGTYEKGDEGHNYDYSYTNDMLQYSDIYPLLNGKMKHILDTRTNSHISGDSDKNDNSSGDRYDGDSSSSQIHTAIEPIRLAHYSRLQSASKSSTPSTANIDNKEDPEREYTVFNILHISCPLTSPVVAFMINLSIININTTAATSGAATTATTSNTTHASHSNSTHTEGETKGRREEVEEGDNRILPTFYSLNYFTLRPGESVYVTIAFNLPITSSTSLNYPRRRRRDADIRGGGDGVSTVLDSDLRSSSSADIRDSGDLNRSRGGDADVRDSGDLNMDRGGEDDVSANITSADLGSSDDAHVRGNSGDVRGRRGDLRNGGSDVSEDISICRNIRLEIEGWNVKKRVYKI